MNHLAGKYLQSLLSISILLLYFITSFYLSCLTSHGGKEYKKHTKEILKNQLIKRGIGTHSSETYGLI